MVYCYLIALGCRVWWVVCLGVVGWCLVDILVVCYVNSVGVIGSFVV